MKSLISILAVTLALAFTGQAFAQQTSGLRGKTDAASCAAAGGKWYQGSCHEG